MCTVSCPVGITQIMGVRLKVVEENNWTTRNKRKRACRKLHEELHL